MKIPFSLQDFIPLASAVNEMKMFFARKWEEEGDHRVYLYFLIIYPGKLAIKSCVYS